MTIFAHNLVTATEKQNNLVIYKTKTPAQAFTPASVGQIRTSHVSFVSTSVPRSFLERCEAVGFCLFVFDFFVICIVPQFRLKNYCVRVVNLYVLRAKDEEPLSFCSGNTCCMCFCPSHGKHAHSG